MIDLELKDNFLHWLSEKSNVSIQNNYYLSAALDAAIRLTCNTTVNSVSIVSLYPPERLYRDIFLRWKSHCLTPLSTNWSNDVQLNVFGVEAPINNPDYKAELESLFYQLETECLE